MNECRPREEEQEGPGAWSGERDEDPLSRLEVEEAQWDTEDDEDAGDVEDELGGGARLQQQVYHCITL